MPIKPIDFQIMIPRTVDASKSQNDEFSRLLSVQKVAGNDVKQESEKVLKQVQHREKAYKTSINGDEKRNQRQKRDNQDKENKQDKEENSSSDLMNKNHSSVHIDIKI